jgi:hypothetical protein
MMRKRNFSGPQNFGKSSSVSGAMNWASNNKIMVAIAAVAIVAFTLSLIAYLKPELVPEQFKDFFSNLRGSKGSSLKELDVVFFKSPTCSWCAKMTEVMEKEGTLKDVTVVDVTNPEGAALAKKFGADQRGIPNFISRKLNTGTVGYKKTTKEIVDALNSVKKAGSTSEMEKEASPHSHEGQAPKEQQSPQAVDPQDVQALGIVAFVSEGCGWCKKTKEEAQALGIMPYLELQDIGTPDGKAVLQQSGIEFKGAPTYWSRTSGKSSVGYRPFNQVISALVE